jgi:hypothetical protein
LAKISSTWYLTIINSEVLYESLLQDQRFFLGVSSKEAIAIIQESNRRFREKIFIGMATKFTYVTFINQLFLTI